MPTKIEWAEETWNPVTGCTKISEGCANCYAERTARRLAGRFGYPEAPHHFDVTRHFDKVGTPLDWWKPRRIFVVSMGDLFHPDVPSSFIGQVFETMAIAHWHTYLVLTKRPERMCEFVVYGLELGTNNFRDLYPHVWLGVTAENQKRADERIPVLLQIPAAGHFVSLEPMLGAVDLTGKPSLGWGAYGAYPEETAWPNYLTGMVFDNDGSVITHDGPSLDWIIAGGESGPGARPMHPQWVRDVRDQCQESGTPFLLKGWGAWLPAGAGLDSWPESQEADGWIDIRGGFTPSYSAMLREGTALYRIGKKAAGRMLDGRERDEYPEALQ